MLETLKIAFAPEYIERGPFEIIYSDDPKLAWDPRGSKTFQNAQTEDHLLRKGTKWAYEKEWRFFLHCGEELTVGMHPLPPDALRAVILGPTLTPPERVEIGIWLKTGPFAEHCNLAQLVGVDADRAMLQTVSA